MSTASEPEDMYASVARLVGARAGLSLTSHRSSGAREGICRAMVRAGLEDIARYRELLEADGDAFDDLISELTVGETYFFRDPAHFAFIRREVLPEIRRRRGGGSPIRTWSAGCASGEEAYSLAIVLVEEGCGEGSRVRATDISRGALGKACAGTYGAWSLRGEGAGSARPYLRPVGERYVIGDPIRQHVDFGYLNLALDVYPSFAAGIWAMDLILCRNVLIYFDREIVRQVARRLFASLAEGGWLITGPSDPPLTDDAPYETVVTDDGVFYRRGAPASRAETPSTRPSPIGELTATALPVAMPAAQGTAAPRAATGRDGRTPDARPAGDVEAEPTASVLRVRSLANRDPSAAEATCAEAVGHHPLSPELHYLRAVLLMELDRDGEAADAARRVLYLDPSLAVAHFTLGTILRRRGDRDGARRAYRNARDVCLPRPVDEVVPLGDGTCAGRLAQAAATQLALLDQAVP